MIPDIRYAKTPEGVHIAYQVSGVDSGGQDVPPLPGSRGREHLVMAPVERAERKGAALSSDRRAATVVGILYIVGISVLELGWTSTAMPRPRGCSRGRVRVHVALQRKRTCSPGLTTQIEKR
jgi:hypothetical protein